MHPKATQKTFLFLLFFLQGLCYNQYCIAICKQRRARLCQRRRNRAARAPKLNIPGRGIGHAPLRRLSSLPARPRPTASGGKLPAFLGTAAGILVLSGIITLILPKSVKGETEPEAPAVTGTTQLVAPLPYAGTNSSDTSGTVQTLNWGTVGPQQQSADTGYTYTATPQKSVQLGQFGRVSTSWFADAAFLGDSLTAGFCANEYNIDVGGALICGYRSISPNTIVNRTTVTNPDRGEEVALDVLAANQPAKLYILLGTNALVQTGNEDSFINYYARMLDELRAALPNTTFYVQSILCATQETVEDDAPGLSPDHIGPINQQIKALCEERGLYYLDLNAEFSDENGYLLTDYAQPDGIHLTVSGYNKWVSYLCTHTPYSKNNPYQPGSTYYLSEEMQSQLADLP